MSVHAMPNIERWLCVYPAYINSKKTIAEGRRIPKKSACENPTYNEIKDICTAAGFKPVFENKLYPRELYRGDPVAKGRIRIEMCKEDGQLVNEKFPTKKALLLHIGEMIPKLKSRSIKQTESHSNQAAKSRKKKR